MIIESVGVRSLRLPGIAERFVRRMEEPWLSQNESERREAVKSIGRELCKHYHVGLTTGNGVSVPKFKGINEGSIDVRKY